MKNLYQNLVLKLFLLIILSLLSGKLHAQKNCADWEWIIKNPELTESKKSGYNDFTTDAYGNSYITGGYYDSIKFGDLKLTALKSGIRTKYIAKLNNKGQWEWAINLNLESDPTFYIWNINAITTDKFGNIYVTGENSNFIYQYYVAKIDNKGKLKWVAKAPSSTNHGIGRSQSILTDGPGNIYIAGSFENSVTFGSTVLSRTVANFIAKIDSSGNWQWANIVDGNYYGITITSDKFENIYALTYDVPQSKVSNLLVSKFKINGSNKWVMKAASWKVKNFESVYFTNQSITTDTAGNIYIAGSFTDTVNFNSSQLITKGQNDKDIFVVQIDSSGQWKWVESAGGNLNDQGLGIISNSIAGVYVTGIISDSVNFGNKTLISNGLSNLFIAEINSQGVWQRVERVEGSGSFNIFNKSNIKLDSIGNLIVAGNFRGTVTFGNKTFTSNSGEFEDFFGKIKGKLKINAGKNYKISCGNSVLLEPSGLGYYTIKWSPIDGLNNPYILNPIASPVKTTTYTITAKNFCGDSVSSQVTVNINSVANITGDSSACPTSVKNYKANTDTTVNYSWSINGGSIQSGQNTDSILVLWNAVGTGIVKLVSTSKFGCKDSTTYSVKIDSAACDWVWPGDANHDKIANSTDVLYIGLAYNETGSVRNNASSSWKAQYADDWSKSFQNGTNFKHADCNGDGIVDSSDITVINNNYGQTWKKQAEIQAPAGPDDAALILEIAKDSILAGDTVIMNIKLGTTNISAKDVYGLAFNIIFDNQLVESNSIKLDLSNSWLDASGKGLISLVKDFNANGTADIAISKTDKTNSSGKGTIGTLSFVLKKDLGGQGNVSKVLNIEIQDIIAISAGADTIPLNTFGDSVIAYQKTSGLQTSIKQDNINIYPNPSNGNFVLDLKNLYAQKIQVINVLGQEIWQANNVQGKTEIQLGNVNIGLYFVNIQTKNGVITKRIIINK